ncbi:MAG: DMT family transporter, partial [Paracoccaceae bacterium]|nr:DMT family transporter [Paracoccaceae bacterium]
MSSVTRAILLSLTALLFFDLMGLIIKLLSRDYNAAELVAYRNIFGLIPSVIALRYSEFWHQENRSFQIRQWPIACIRGLIVALAQLMFYLSLGRIAFATATTISYSNALFMTIFAIVLLGERVGVIRWAAVLIGFAGVMMVTGLGTDTFSWNAVLPIGAAALYAISGVTARLMDSNVPSAVVNMYSTVFAVLGSLAIVLVFDGFSPVQSGTDILWIITMGACGGTAVIILIVSFRMTEQSNLAPFTYFGIPLAIVLGWLFFDEAPLADLFP